MTQLPPPPGALPPPPLPPPPKRGQRPVMQTVRAAAAEDRDRKVRVLGTVVVIATLPIWFFLFFLLLLSIAPHDARVAHTAFWIYPIIVAVGLGGSWILTVRNTQRTLSLVLLALPIAGALFWFVAFVELASS